MITEPAFHVKREVVRTFPGVEGPPIWLDVVRTGPGQYNVELAHNGQILGEGFLLPVHAEEWIIDLQAQQRGWVRVS